jgi:cytochrome c biogenesis protein CcmG, thiol:disulfide interchange protein DsbE
VNRAGRATIAGLIVPMFLCLAACGDEGSSSGGDRTGPFAVGEGSDELPALKAEAGIAPCPRSDGVPAPSGGLPDVTLACLGGGRSVNLSKLTGTPLVVNIWAQWCGPCRAEAPAFAALHDDADRRVRIIGIDLQDTQPDLAIAFADELGLTYPQLADPDGSIRAPLRFQGPPRTYFVDAGGEITYVESGPVTSEDELKSLVSQHLGVDL